MLTQIYRVKSERRTLVGELSETWSDFSFWITTEAETLCRSLQALILKLRNESTSFLSHSEEKPDAEIPVQPLRADVHLDPGSHNKFSLGKPRLTAVRNLSLWPEKKKKKHTRAFVFLHQVQPVKPTSDPTSDPTMSFWSGTAAWAKPPSWKEPKVGSFH